MNAASLQGAAGATPVVTELTVVPVAGHDSMLMNLSGLTARTSPATS